MEDPVTTADGHTFERAAIARWLQKCTRSPLTNLPLEAATLLPNYALRKAIGEYARLAAPGSPQKTKPEEVTLSQVSGPADTVKVGLWRGRQVTLYQCSEVDYRQHTLALKSLGNSKHLGKTHGVVLDTSVTPHAYQIIGESGSSLTDAIAYMQSQNQTLTMSAVLNIAEQLCEALETLVESGIFVDRLHCNDILCLELDDNDRTATQVKIMSWKMTDAILSSSDTTSHAKMEAASLAEFAHLLCELCRLAATPNALWDGADCDCAYAAPVDGTSTPACDRHLHVPVWSRAVLAAVACRPRLNQPTQQPTYCGVDLRRSCLYCSHPLCSRILRPCLVPDVLPRLTFARLRVLLRAAGFDVAVQSALWAAKKLSLAASGQSQVRKKIHIFAIHNHANDMHSLSLPAGTVEASVRKGSSSLRIYNWAPLGAVPTRRRWFACVKTADGIVVLGGRLGQEWYGTVEIMSPKTGQWSRLPSMIVARSSFGAAVHQSKELVVAGGHNDTGFLGLVEAFDLEKQTWRQWPSLPGPRFACGAIEYRGRVHVLGGDDGKKILDTVLVWDEERGEWSLAPPMPLPRAACAVAVADDSLVVLGGFDGEDDVDSVFVYDGTAWRTASAMPFRTSWCCASGIGDGKIVLSGGLRGSRSVNRNLVYDVRTDTWTPLRSLSFATTEIAVVAWP